MSLAEVPLTEYSSVVNWLTAGRAATCQARPFQCSMSWLRRPVPPPLCDPTAHALAGDAAYTSRRMPSPEVGPGVIVQAACASAGGPAASTATAGTIAPQTNATLLRNFMTGGLLACQSGTGHATSGSAPRAADRALAPSWPVGPGEVLNVFCRAAAAVHAPAVWWIAFASGSRGKSRTATSRPLVSQRITN